MESDQPFHKPNKHVLDELATPRTLQPSLKWEKISTGQLYCNKNRKFTTMWREGSNLVVGTDGGLKDGVGTAGAYLEMEEDNSVFITAMSGESCKLSTLNRHGKNSEHSYVLKC